VTTAGVFNPVAAGIGSHIVTYTFTSSSTGCSKSATVTVTVTANPLPNPGANVQVCFGSAIFALGGSPAGELRRVRLTRQV
jgi:hypothetical protein